MAGALKIKSVSHIQPDRVEYYPTLCQKPSSPVLNLNKYAGFEENPALLRDFFKDVKSLSLKGLFAWQLDYLALLRHFDTIQELYSDVLAGDGISASIKRAFKNTVFNPAVREVQQLIAYGHDDKAIELLDKLTRKLEEQNDYELRAKFCNMKAGLQMKNGRLLAAAVYFIESASIVSTNSKIETLDKEQNPIQINKAGSYYHLALVCLSAHVKVNGIDPNYTQLFKDFSQRAECFFEKQARKSESSLNFSRKGSIAFGSVKIPYGFGQDEASATINRKLALEVQRLNDLNSKREQIKDLNYYLAQEFFREEDSEFLWEILEKLDQDQSPAYSDVMNFHDFMMIKNPNHRSTIEILKIKSQVRYQKASINELLRSFKYLDAAKQNADTFLMLILLADKVSSLCPKDERVEFVSLVMEKNYPHMPESLKEAYQKILHPEGSNLNPNIAALYPGSFEEFKKSFDKLEVSNHDLLYQGAVLTLGHEEYQDILIQRARHKFSSENFLAFQHRQSIGPAPSRVQIKSELVHETEFLINSILRDLPLESELSYLKTRVQNKYSHLGVFGLTKVGKTTFLNALLEKELLKADRAIATNVPTLIKNSKSNHGLVHFQDQSSKEISINELAEYTSEQGNPSNRLNVLNVEVLLECSLPQKLVLIDVPGFGVDSGCFALHNQVIEEAINLVDAAFLVTTPADGLKNFEIEFIKKITLEKKLPFILIANKVDGIEESEKNDLLSALKERLSQNQVPLENLEIIFTSGQLGLSFIDNVAESKLMGFTIEEAKVESNFTQVKQSLGRIEESIQRTKNTSIHSKLLRELSLFQEQQELHLMDLEKMQAGSKSEMEYDLNFLKDECKVLVDTIDMISESNNLVAQRISALNCQKMGKLAALRFPTDTKKAMHEDMQHLFEKCQEVFKEQLGTLVGESDEDLQDQKLTLEACYHKMAPLVGEVAVLNIVTGPIQKPETNFSNYHKLLHITKKILASRDAFESNCVSMLEIIKSQELILRDTKSLPLINQAQRTLETVQQRITKKEETLKYKGKQFEEQTKIAHEFVRLCKLYKAKVENAKS